MPDPSSEYPTIPVSAQPPAPKRRRRWLRITLWSFASLIVLLIVAAASGVFYLRHAAKAALPLLDGDIQLAGLSAPVTVRRDAHGVPHIEAATQEDLFVAQGYVTAQDRLWQMDAARRNANGELAEILGSSLVPHDRAQRVLQFRNTAQRVYAAMPADDRARFEAYARGVNLYISQHQDSLPPEFRLLHYKPQPWNGVDSVSIGMTMVDLLDTHWDVKFVRGSISDKLNNQKLESDLYPVGSWRDHPPTGAVLDLSQPHAEPSPLPPADLDDDRNQTRITTAPDLRELRATLGLPSCEGCAAGSNNWVIAGSHTASGKPLLSNDMHLGLNVPNIWYMADLSAPGFHATGVTLPGVPCVIAGHNEHIAWGFTALYGDVQDLYTEKTDGKGHFEDNDGTWKRLAIDQEIIHVRGHKDVEFDVQLTPHGPLINPMFAKDHYPPTSLKWTLYDTTLNTIPLYALNTASNWTEFSGALQQWNWPTQNVVYSDDQGHIAYHAVGKVPIRSMWSGRPLPHDTMNPRYEWGMPKVANGNYAGNEIYIPFDDMPNAFDPPSGFLATANSCVTSDKSNFKLTDEWADPYRAERIYKLLQGRDHLTPADMLAVQTDIYSEMDQEMAHRIAYAIDHAAGADDRLRKAADLMRSWDGRLTTDSAAASLVTQTRQALWPLILEPKLGKELAADYRWSESNFAEEEIVMHANPAWLPSGFKDWDALITEAVRKAMKDGNAPADVSKWTYGSWHVVDLGHPLAGLLPWIGKIAGTGPQPLSGDTITVKQVGRAFGPSQRFTMDWSNIDGSTEDIVLGESGNPYSPYFRDQWDDYYNGRTFALPYTSGAVAAQTRHTLHLLP